jgi:uncharacterized repeat protein (TIGR01451 family)
LLLSALIFLALAGNMAVQGLGTVGVSTDSATYRIGDSVTVSIDTSHDIVPFSPVSAIVDIGGPVTRRWGPFSFVTGGVYTLRLSDVTPLAGYYYVNVALNMSYATYEGTTTYLVTETIPFDFFLTVSPSSLSVKLGGTANYDVSVRYSHPSYNSAVVIINVSGLGSGMTYSLSKEGLLSIQTSDATPADTYTIELTGSAQGVTRVVTTLLVVEEPKAVLTNLSVSAIPAFGGAIYVGQSSTATIAISNTGNAIAHGVRVILEEITPSSGVTVTDTDPPQDIPPLGTGRWTIEVRGDLPGSYKGVLRVYEGNELVVGHQWDLDVLGPQISVSLGETPARDAPVYAGDTFTLAYTLKNTSPIDANNVSVVVFVHDLTVVQKSSVAAIPSQSEVKAQIRLRSDIAGNAWVKIIVSSQGATIYEDTLDITIFQRPIWEQRPFLLVLGVGATLIAVGAIELRQRSQDHSDNPSPAKSENGELASL